MNKNLILSLLLVSFTLVNFSQEKIKGNKVVTIIETAVSPFNKIVASEKFKIALVKSDTPSVEIETDENLHDAIEFNVKDNTLTFKTTMKITSNKKLNIRVKYAQKLIRIEAKDNADLSAVSTIESDTLTLNTYGNSKVVFNLTSQQFNLANGEKSKVELNIESAYVNLDLNESSRLDARISSDSLMINMNKNATATLEGDSSYLEVEALDSANLKSKNLSAETCKVKADNSSDISIKVSESISIDAAGNSEIKLYDEPTITIDRFAGKTRLIKKEK